MRVISGRAKGTKLLSPEGLATRPTTDRVKESLFSALQFELPQKKVLDLFAGSGQLAIEAVSRGASGAVACDKNPKACAVIRQNIDKCRLGDAINVYCCEFDRIHQHLPLGTAFDLVFLDPPYKTGLALSAMDYLRSKKLLNPGALLSLESDAGENITAAGYTLLRSYQYGNIKISLYMAEEAPENENCDLPGQL